MPAEYLLNPPHQVLNNYKEKNKTKQKQKRHKKMSHYQSREKHKMADNWQFIGQSESFAKV